MFLLAVELFAVAPKSFKRRDSNTYNNRARARTAQFFLNLFSTFLKHP